MLGAIFKEAKDAILELVNPELGARPHPGRRQSQYSWAQMDPSAHSLAFRGGAEVPDEVTANIVGGQQV